MITGYRNTVEPLPDGKTMPLVDLLDPLPDELKPLCQELRPKVEALNENDLRGHFEIGQILKQEIPGSRVNYRRMVEVATEPTCLSNWVCNSTFIHGFCGAVWKWPSASLLRSTKLASSNLD